MFVGKVYTAWETFHRLAHFLKATQQLQLVWSKVRKLRLSSGFLMWVQRPKGQAILCSLPRSSGWVELKMEKLEHESAPTWNANTVCGGPAHPASTPFLCITVLHVINSNFKPSKVVMIHEARNQTAVPQLLHNNVCSYCLELCFKRLNYLFVHLE